MGDALYKLYNDVLHKYERDDLEYKEAGDDDAGASQLDILEKNANAFLGTNLIPAKARLVHNVHHPSVGGLIGLYPGSEWVKRLVDVGHSWPKFLVHGGIMFAKWNGADSTVSFYDTFDDNSPFVYQGTYKIIDTCMGLKNVLVVNRMGNPFWEYVFKFEDFGREHENLMVDFDAKRLFDKPSTFSRQIQFNLITRCLKPISKRLERPLLRKFILPKLFNLPENVELGDRMNQEIQANPWSQVEEHTFAEAELLVRVFMYHILDVPDRQDDLNVLQCVQYLLESKYTLMQSILRIHEARVRGIHAVPIEWYTLLANDVYSPSNNVIQNMVTHVRKTLDSILDDVPLWKLKYLYALCYYNEPSESFPTLLIEHKVDDDGNDATPIEIENGYDYNDNNFQPGPTLLITDGKNQDNNDNNIQSGPTLLITGDTHMSVKKNEFDAFLRRIIQNNGTLQNIAAVESTDYSSPMFEQEFKGIFMGLIDYIDLDAYRVLAANKFIDIDSRIPESSNEDDELGYVMKHIYNPSTLLKTLFYKTIEECKTDNGYNINLLELPKQYLILRVFALYLGWFGLEKTKRELHTDSFEKILMQFHITTIQYKAMFFDIALDIARRDENTRQGVIRKFVSRIIRANEEATDKQNLYKHIFNAIKNMLEPRIQPTRSTVSKKNKQIQGGFDITF